MTIPTCCGADLLTGVRRDVACTLLPLKCGLLGCAKFIYPQADDGTPPAAGQVIEPRCVSGACRTHVLSALDGGPGPSCDTISCAATEICVHPPSSVGGAPPPCEPLTDAGTCPPGTELQSTCGGLPSGGCVAVYTPPAAYCATLPATCGGAPTCGCLPADVCGGGADICGSVSDRDVWCVNMAP